MTDWKPTGRSRLRRKWLFWRVLEDEQRRIVEDDTGLRLGFHDANPREFEQTRWVPSYPEQTSD